jgi:hypothetical protein
MKLTEVDPRTVTPDGQGQEMPPLQITVFEIAITEPRLTLQRQTSAISTQVCEKTVRRIETRGIGKSRVAKKRSSFVRGSLGKSSRDKLAIACRFTSLPKKHTDEFYLKDEKEIHNRIP